MTYTNLYNSKNNNHIKHKLILKCNNKIKSKINIKYCLENSL